MLHGLSLAGTRRVVGVVAPRDEGMCAEFSANHGGMIVSMPQENKDGIMVPAAVLATDGMSTYMIVDEKYVWQMQRKENGLAARH